MSSSVPVPVNVRCILGPCSTQRVSKRWLHACEVAFQGEHRQARLRSTSGACVHYICLENKAVVTGRAHAGILAN